MGDVRELNVVQRWFQHVVTHPHGPVDGAMDDDAQRLIRMNRGELESVINRSANLTAEDRIAIYANAYYARLLECLGESLPILKRTIGDEAFDDFAFDYLQQHPSTSYTLGKLADRFAEYLEANRPDREPDGSVPGVGFADLLIDLARLERVIEDVFDGPGIERVRTLDADDLAAIPAESFGDCRIETVVCLRMMAFKYPVNAYYTAIRRAGDDEHIQPPDPEPEYAAISRRDYVVRRFVLTEPQYRLLAALQEGATVAEAMQRAAEVYAGDDAQLIADLRAWFTEWSAAQLFQRVVLPD